MNQYFVVRVNKEPLDIHASLTSLEEAKELACALPIDFLEWGVVYANSVQEAWRTIPCKWNTYTLDSCDTNVPHAWHK